MNLSQLKNTKGARKKRKLVGRGPGSGHGKTSCRGFKGQLSRSGGGKGPYFEGGQMPLYRRLPKRGFTNIFAKEYSIVNVGRLNGFADGENITPEVLYKAGIANKNYPVKILGDGKLEKKLSITAHKFSKGAIESIERRGGSWEQIGAKKKKKVEKKEKQEPKQS